MVSGEITGQGLRIASKSLWDVNYDNWASYTYQNDNMFCTAMVFGVYFEWTNDINCMKINIKFAFL